MRAPYFQDKSVTIYHGDCRDVLPEVVDGASVVLTDPPYGIEGGRGVGNRARGKAMYEESVSYAPGEWADTPDYIEFTIVPLVAWLTACVERVVLTPGIRHLHLYPQAADIGCFWTPASVGTGSWGLVTYHPILYYGRDPRAGIGAWPSGKQVTEIPERNGHPCPKPFNAWKWLLAKASVDESDVVLDPFMGSGTTLRAAKDLGRKAIGIEIEERYCEIAARRMAQGVLL